jgi:hypothetical protein
MTYYSDTALNNLPMTIEEQIGKLKVQAVNTTDMNILLKIIDELGTYGSGEYRTRAIDAILFIVNTNTDKDVKAHASRVIKEIKEGKL